MTKRKTKVKEEDINKVFEPTSLPKKEEKSTFERRLEELAKKYDPIKEWGKFYAEVKKNKYFGKDIKELLKWKNK